MRQNVAAIVQARLGSKRFPRKVLADLNGKTVLEHVLERAYQICGKVILATPDVELIDYWPQSIGGSQEDVLSRYLWAATAYDIDTIIRITADCPLLRPDLCKQVLQLFQSGECAYAAIGWPRGGFPKGYGCEVFSRFTLELAHNYAKSARDREHVTPWMTRNVTCQYLQNDKKESHLNYCVDTPEDLERLRKLTGAQDH